jgi:hypothetical protein
LIVGPIKGIEKPMRISRPSADKLVLTRSRFGALIRLLIWLAIVGGFYWVLLTEQSQSLVQAQPAPWLLVLVPLFLLPYLVDITRVLVRGESHVFDAGVGELRAAQHAPVPFAQIQCLELNAVNGGCEELTLRARLLDGRSIELVTGGASSRLVKLAAEAANLAGVGLTRR